MYVDEDLRILKNTCDLIKSAERSLKTALNRSSYSDSERLVISECLGTIKSLKNLYDITFARIKKIKLLKKEKSKVIKSKTGIKKKKIKHPRRAGKKTKSKSVWTVSGGLPSLGKRN